jgi:hypothetical protein
VGIILDTYDGMVAEGSILDKWIKALQYAEAGTMPPPPAAKLSANDLRTLRAWIDAGADEAPATFESGLTCTSREPPVSSARRLSNFELRNTLSQLFPTQVMDGLSDAIDHLPEAGAGSLDILSAEMNAEFADALYGVAKSASDILRTNPAATAALVPCWSAAGSDAKKQTTCVSEFIPQFTSHVFRRPPTASETAASAAMQAALATAKLTPVQILAASVQSLLFSPQFYLLPELDAKSGEKPFVISDYVLASRLSYALTGSMPDDELFAAAAAGNLTESGVLAAQSARLMQSEGFARQLDHISGQWLQLDGLSTPITDAVSTPEQAEALVQSMQNDVVATIRQIVLVDKGGFRDLFTTTKAYVDSPALARIYGLDAKADATLPAFVDLGASRRTGILTRAGILSYDATEVLTTIRRARFIRETLLGQSIGSPPANVSLDNDAGGPARTLRERLETATKSYTCAFCHNRLNPLGFALGNFDASGIYRTTALNADARAGTVAIKIDAKVDPNLDVKGRDEISSGSELSKLIATSKDARLTFAKVWYEALSGLRVVPEQACVVDDMWKAIDSDASVLEMVKALVAAPEFTRKSY